MFLDALGRNISVGDYVFYHGDVYHVERVAINRFNEPCIFLQYLIEWMIIKVPKRVRSDHTLLLRREDADLCLRNEKRRTDELQARRV